MDVFAFTKSLWADIPTFKQTPDSQLIVWKILEAFTPPNSPSQGHYSLEPHWICSLHSSHTLWNSRYFHKSKIHELVNRSQELHSHSGFCPWKKRKIHTLFSIKSWLSSTIIILIFKTPCLGKSTDREKPTFPYQWCSCSNTLKITSLDYINSSNNLNITLV